MRTKWITRWDGSAIRRLEDNAMQLRIETGEKRLIGIVRNRLFTFQRNRGQYHKTYHALGLSMGLIVSAKKFGFDAFRLLEGVTEKGETFGGLLSVKTIRYGMKLKGEHRLRKDRFPPFEEQVFIPPWLWEQGSYGEGEDA